MIDIEEQEDTPIGCSGIIQNENVKNIAISVPKDNTVVVNHLDSQSNQNNTNEVKNNGECEGEGEGEGDNDSNTDAFSALMSKIPMKGKAKTKIISPKSTSIKTGKTIEKKQNTLESLLNTVTTNTIANATTTSVNTVATVATVADDTEELKPIGKYNLLELQMLAKLYKIDTQKQGSSAKKINKTKGEMYEEIQEKMNK